MASEAVNQVVADYYRDFSTLNVQAILPYFNEPSLLVGPQEVISIPDRAAARGCFWSGHGGSASQRIWPERIRTGPRQVAQFVRCVNWRSGGAVQDRWPATGARRRNLRAPQNGEWLEIRHGYPSRSKHATACRFLRNPVSTYRFKRLLHSRRVQSGSLICPARWWPDLAQSGCSPHRQTR